MGSEVESVGSERTVETTSAMMGIDPRLSLEKHGIAEIGEVLRLVGSGIYKARPASAVGAAVDVGIFSLGAKALSGKKKKKVDPRYEDMIRNETLVE